MKYPLPSSAYSFNAAAGTITFTDPVPVELANIMHVANLTRGVLLFQPQGGAAFAGTYAPPVLTLAASTAGHSDSDSLLIVYDDGEAGATEATAGALNAKLPGPEAGRVPVSDGGILTAGRESFDQADSTLASLVLQQDAVPDPRNPTGAALQVTLRDPVQLDQGVPTVVGGVDPAGAVRGAKVGTDGGLQLTDGKQFVGISQAVNTSPTGWIDTTGYQSIVVTFFGGSSATVVFQTTNDITYTVAAGNAASYNVSGGQSAALSLVNPGNGVTQVIPVTGRYFRIYVTGYNSGVVGCVVNLRAAPFTPALITTPNVNAAQVGGVSTLINTPGSVPANGVLRPGYQFNTYNATYGPATQTLASQTAANSFTAPVTTGGFDGASVSRTFLTDSLGAQAFTSAPSNPAQQSIHELLYQILATLRASAHYQYELAFGDKPRSAADEPDSLIGDYLNQASQFVNIIN